MQRRQSWPARRQCDTLAVIHKLDVLGIIFLLIRIPLYIRGVLISCCVNEVLCKSFERADSSIELYNILDNHAYIHAERYY